MSDVAIRVENLSKRYRRGVPAGNDRLSEVAVNLSRLAWSLPRRLAGRVRSPDAAGAAPAPSDEFWALKDVSFEVKRGEVVGIIGRNGAGKSTLLKVLSRITEPTAGRFGVRGRVASLLEVGTGFHGELTGRENVYLSGALLGMSRAEIAKKFDEIVAFAEVDGFLDTPVKRYSSGMLMRLAFAVAAHLEAEILIIDEVLAVGDAQFQKKCLGKMGEVAKGGRTVLFVSHNTQTISRLCSRAVLLGEGVVIATGKSDKVVIKYLRADQGTTAARFWEGALAPGNDVARLRSLRVQTDDGALAETLDIRRQVGVEVVFEVLTGGEVLIPNLHFYTADGICAFIAGDSHDPEWRRRPRPAGLYTTVMWIPGNFLAEGMMRVSAAVSTVTPVRVHVWEQDAVSFTVVDSQDGSTNRSDYTGSFPGVVRPRFRWETRYSPPSEVAG